MIRLHLGQIIGILSVLKKKLKQVALYCMVGVVIAGAAQMAGADFTISPTTLQSTGPCLFAKQLQESASIRKQYTTRLIAANSGAVSASNTIGIDTLSADCLGCHDGVSAQLITSVLKNNPFKESSSLGRDYSMNGMDHSIGMDYDSYVAASKEYKPISATSNEMVFVNSKVGCLTCHNPLLPEKGHLVISDRNSVLCYTCHDK
jgi:predicted CXXCH cytochrome family protein